MDDEIVNIRCWFRLGHFLCAICLNGYRRSRTKRHPAQPAYKHQTCICLCHHYRTFCVIRTTIKWIFDSIQYTIYMYTYKICRIYADVRASKIYYTHYEHLSTRNTTRTPYRYVGYILLYLSIALCTANELHVCRNAIITLGLVLLAMLHLVANVYSAPPHQAYSMSECVQC